jgi:hypothetical protein
MEQVVRTLTTKVECAEHIMEKPSLIGQVDQTLNKQTSNVQSTNVMGKNIMD